MDTELIILVLIVGGVWFFYNEKISSAPIPGIGNQSGIALIGPTTVVNKEAASTNSFYQNKKVGSIGAADMSKQPLVDPTLPIYYNKKTMYPNSGGIFPYEKTKRKF